MPATWIGVVAVFLFGAAVVGTWLFWNEVRQSLPERFEPTDGDMGNIDSSAPEAVIPAVERGAGSPPET